MQFYFLPDAIQLKKNRVFYESDVGIVLLRQGRFYKNIQAVIACNFYIGELISLYAIHIDAKTGFSGIGKIMEVINNAFLFGLYTFS